MSQQGVRLLSSLALLCVSLGFSPSALAADVTYASPTVNGYLVGTYYPKSGSSPADTARRFCQDRGHVGALNQVTTIRSSTYTFINGTGGIGNWSVTGNANVTMLDSITCSDTRFTYSAPKVNGYLVGTLHPTSGSTAADTARRFCHDRNHVDVQSYVTNIRSSTYTFINGAGGNGNWSVTGNANVTMLDSITCIGSGVTYRGPTVNGYYVGTYYPTSGSSPTDTARRYCQDHGHVGAQGQVTSLRSSTYTFINGTGGIGNWSVTGNSNVTMLDAITCSL
ncbi:hypothetical protein [Archangium sp.]|jgi:hypothetical protein|uniref:hypothetical protein n=1 Tax=Archangium sp. TaxID=1872627 RepID=UPI002EDAA7CD